MTEGIAIVPRTITRAVVQGGLATSLLSLAACDEPELMDDADAMTVTLRSSSLAAARLHDMSMGDGEAWVVGDNGQLEGWGRRYCGPNGCLQPAEIAPLPLPGLAAQVVTNGQQSAVLLDDGSVLGWGSTLADTQDLSPVSFAAPVAELAMGADFLCARFDDGEVACRDIAGVPAPSWLDAFTLTQSTVELSAGSRHVCARTDSGDVACWGDDAPTPTTMTSGAVSIAAGGGHTCALTSAGEVRCWGRNGEGQLGHAQSGVGTVTLPEAASAVTAGAEHSCAIGAQGDALYCWGSDAVGQLGVGTDDSHGIRHVDLDGHEVSRIFAGAMAYTTFAQLETAGLRGWGLGDVGQTGYGELTKGDSGSVMAVGDLPDIIVLRIPDED